MRGERNWQPLRRDSRQTLPEVERISHSTGLRSIGRLQQLSPRTEHIGWMPRPGWHSRQPPSAANLGPPASARQLRSRPVINAQCATLLEPARSLAIFSCLLVRIQSAGREQRCSSGVYSEALSALAYSITAAERCCRHPHISRIPPFWRATAAFGGIPIHPKLFGGDASC